MRQQRRPRAEKTALVQAVDLLARQEHSTAKLTEKLRQRGYAAEEIAAAIERLTERGYLNDEAACAREFQYFYDDSRMSVRQICLKLGQRGFDSSLVRQCVPADIFARELRAACRCLNIKFARAATPQKMQQYLYTRGFSGSVCRTATDHFLAEHETEEDNGFEE